ncbi:MAG TPA: enoyl-CoA hydratase [Bryobacteraceae bacterium]|nr:enoyl-CoA hydratase [Bryobacteraceae bacterium]
MPYSHLTLALEGPTAIMTLNRPAQRNALSLALMREVIECLSELERNREARVIIFAAAGPAFCAGHDLREMTCLGADAYREIFAVCTQMMTTIQSVPQPVIAEVQGMATAAGCQLVATCDLAIASERATFATPGVRIGLFCSTPMVAVSRVLGRKRGLEMLLTGDAIDACTAADWGLVNRVVPEAELRAATLALAERIGHASAFTIKTGKQAFYRQADLPQAEAYAFTQEVMTENALAADAQEGICAFLDKRPPRWQGR